MDLDNIRQFMLLSTHLWTTCVQHPTLKGDIFERLSPVMAQVSPIWPTLIMQRHLSEASSPSSSHSTFPPLTETAVSAAQLDVRHAAAPLCSVDTEFNLFQSCNSIISPGSCSTTREWKGGKGVFNTREGEREVEDVGGGKTYHKHKPSSTWI